jgi:glutathione synthase/RimK-type ligase-like ATP-grasp enzyme
MKYILVIAKHDDIHAISVCNALARRADICPLTLDTAQYPEMWQLAFYTATGGMTEFELDTGEHRITRDNLLAVWWRRPQRYALDRAVHDPKIVDFCIAESRSALDGWLHSLGRRVINPLSAHRVADTKAFQLQCASSVGLTIPRTLITNSAARAREFISSLGTPVIFKTLTATDWTFSETRRVRDDDLKLLMKLSHAPVIFQEEIPRGLDIRVTVVDDRIFPVAIEPQHPKAQLDWRLDPAAAIKACSIPINVETGIHALMEKLDLAYGAIDLRRSHDGRFVFLEVNPGGQFLFAEIHGDQKISAALADALIRRGEIPMPSAVPHSTAS